MKNCSKESTKHFNKQNQIGMIIFHQNLFLIFGIKTAMIARLIKTLKRIK